MHKIFTGRRAFSILAAIALIGGLHVLEIQPAEAQSMGGDWSTPILLFETEDKARLHTPIAVADRSGQVHVFWSVDSPAESIIQEIYYSRWDGQAWSNAIDVVSLPEAASPSATADPYGNIHLLWSGPLGSLQTSSVPSSEATSAHGWKDPVNLGISNRTAAIVSDRTGTIHVAYPGVANTGVYYVFSDDGGATWSAPINAAPTSDETTSADYLDLAVDSGGDLHIVWTEFRLPTGWPPIGVYHAKSQDAGQTWLEPIELAGEGYDQISIAIAKDSTIHVAWNGMAGVGGRYHRWSSNGGRKWSEISVVVPPGQCGTEGPPQLVVDSAGMPHMLTTCNVGAFYSYWQDRQWTEPINISGEEATASGHTEEPAMALTGGNRLHAVFWDDEKRLWYSTKTTSSPSEAPSLPLIESASPVAIPSLFPLNAQAPEPNRASSEPVGSNRLSRKTTSPIRGFSAAILPAALVVGVFVLVRTLTRRY